MKILYIYYTVLSVSLLSTGGWAEAKPPKLSLFQKLTTKLKGAQRAVTSKVTSVVASAKTVVKKVPNLPGMIKEKAHGIINKEKGNLGTGKAHVPLTTQLKQTHINIQTKGVNQRTKLATTRSLKASGAIVSTLTQNIYKKLKK